MGCDIHVHSEVKIMGRWLHYNHPDVSRCYDLFSRMAGVRRDGGSPEPIAEPRGLPLDVSVVTLFESDVMGEDGHSHSFLVASEIVLLHDWMETNMKPKYGSAFDEEFGWLFGNSHYDFVTIGQRDFERERELGLEDVRFVFWFDN